MNSSSFDGIPSSRITLVFWEGYIGAAPSIVNSIRVLEESGFRVELFTRASEAGYPPTPEFSDSTRVAICTPWSSAWARLGLPGRPPGFDKPWGEKFRRKLSFAARCKVLIQSVLGTLLLIADRIQFRLFIRHNTKDNSRRFWIGIDPLGIIEANRHAENGLLAYWSLEIIFGADLSNPILRLLKIAERRASQRANPILVPDEARAELICRENRLDSDRVVLVPNAPRAASGSSRSTFLHDRLKIDPEMRIVLHLGMMGPEVLSTEIARSVSGWPDDCVLVYHERFSRTVEDPVVAEAKRAAGDLAFFSLEPVQLDELGKIVASADIGLVFYNPKMGPNFSVITGASGKLAYYLQAGLPVICLDLPGFKDLVDETGCGVCVQSADEIGAALRVLFDDPHRFRQAARRCFEDRYAFDRFFLGVVDRLRSALDARE